VALLKTRRAGSDGAGPEQALALYKTATAKSAAEGRDDPTGLAMLGQLQVRSVHSIPPRPRQIRGAAEG
jgi:hypothetical protein